MTTTADAERTLFTGGLADVPTVPAAFQANVRRVPERIALRTITGEPELTWAEFGSRVEALAAGLAGLGLGRGDHIAMMTSNSPEFHLLDTAAMHVGIVPTSIYNSLPPEDIAFILDDLGTKYAFAEPAFFDRMLKGAELSTSKPTIVAIADEAGPADRTLAEVEASPAAGFDFAAAWRGLDPEDSALVSYTSGTTGNPKGVMLSHRAVLGSLEALDRTMGTIDGARVVSFLPMAHYGGRVFGHYPMLAYGWTVSCCRDINQVPRYLVDTRPDYLCSPPRLFEKLRGAIETRLSGDEEGWGAAGRQALDLGLRKVDLEQEGRSVPDDLREEWEQARDTHLVPMLRELGLDRVVVSQTGSASVPPHLVRFFLALGLPILETWGMTECAAFGSTNRPDDVRMGTVGYAFPGAEIVLAEDGEILFRSPWMMSGYLNRPDQTAETVDEDGWLHSGDIGELDPDGRLMVVDRKKELIISAFGKNMSPANIEAKLKAAHPVIGQACAIGDGRKFNVALLILDPQVASSVAGQELPIEEMVEDPSVVAAVDEAVKTANGRMAQVETIKYYRILPEVWEPGGDALSPTMKLRRKPIAEKYEAEIEELYRV